MKWKKKQKKKNILKFKPVCYVNAKIYLFYVVDLKLASKDHNRLAIRFSFDVGIRICGFEFSNLSGGWLHYLKLLI